MRPAEAVLGRSRKASERSRSCPGGLWGSSCGSVGRFNAFQQPRRPIGNEKARCYECTACRTILNSLATRGPLGSVFGPVLGGLCESLWAVVEASWGVWGASWGYWTICAAYYYSRLIIAVTLLRLIIHVERGCPRGRRAESIQRAVITTATYMVREIGQGRRPGHSESIDIATGGNVARSGATP